MASSSDKQAVINAMKRRVRIRGELTSGPIADYNEIYMLEVIMLALG